MSEPVFSAHIAGLPAPQGSKRHVGGGRMVESSKKVAPWREAVVNAIHAHHDGPWPLFPQHMPLSVSLTFTLPAPLSLPKTRPSSPSKKPDLDKLVRATFDALTTSGLWVDDSQAVEVRARKTYPEATTGAHFMALAWPGVRIFIRPDTD